MSRSEYQLVSDVTEDILDETDTLDAAVQLARDLAAGCPTGEGVLVTHGGRALRQVRLTSGGQVVEEVVGEAVGRSASV